MRAVQNDFPEWWQIGHSRNAKYWGFAVVLALLAHGAVLAIWNWAYKPVEYAPQVSAIQVRIGNGGVLTDKETSDSQPAATGNVMADYESKLSSWIGKHRFYPEEAKKSGITGTAVIRIKLNRDGTLAAQSIETSSGAPLLDKAAIEIARNSSPMPRIPAEYPGAKEIEFLIPVIFK